jgi:hypothetical protein
MAASRQMFEGAGSCAESRRSVQSVYGAKTLSRRQLILVNNTAETIAAHNTSITGRRHRCGRTSGLRWRERQRAIRSVTIVVIDERRKDSLKVLRVQNEQPVETF